MRPSFNTSGPCMSAEHYMLSPEPRLRAVMRLIDERQYLTLHAGRQTGKTTSAMWLADSYNEGDTYRAMWVDFLSARQEPDVGVAMGEVLQCFTDATKRLSGLLQAPTRAECAEMLKTPSHAVLRWFRQVASQCPKPLVVLIDEADGLVGPALGSFLAQIRAGYIDRDALPFPHSIVLLGQRQVRDEAFSPEDRRAAGWVGSTSPFNITAEAATLRAFTKEDVFELLLLHTTQTGQRWEPSAMELIYELSQGHPWLVNAVADQVVNRDVRDRAVAITTEHVRVAKEPLIVDRRSHVDSLQARLREDRVRRILDPMLAGGRAESDDLDGDLSYVLDMGLISKQDGRYHVANPIYGEFIPWALSYNHQMQIAHKPEWYMRKDGTLDVRKLMEGWQVFWRMDGHLVAQSFRYKESGPHLMLMAFLQRIVYDGGRIDREYGLGRGALDLLVTWKGERHVIEAKVRRDTETEPEALDQVARYLDTLGEPCGWLVLFDLRKKASWEKKLFVREVEHGGKRIWIVGC